MISNADKTDRSLRNFGAVSAWLVFVLILLFAAVSIALIALGGQAYRTVGSIADENAHRRASVGYVMSRIQAFDRAGAVRVEQMNVDGQLLDVLVFSEEIDGEEYETRLYCAGNMLREQFVSADTRLETAEDGEVIAQLQGLQAERSGKLLTLQFEHPDGSHQTMHAALQSEEE